METKSTENVDQEQMFETTEGGMMAVNGLHKLMYTPSLSSTYAAFTLRSGTSEWSWADKDGITSSIACGCAPLDLDPEQAATLDVPDYNRMDSVPYLLSCVILPDRVLLREWDIQDLGSTDAEPLSETQYSETLPIELKKGRVYELVAAWEEEKGRLEQLLPKYWPSQEPQEEAKPLLWLQYAEWEKRSLPNRPYRPFWLPAPGN